MNSSVWKSSLIWKGAEIMVLDPPIKKTVLWHITGRCNQSCVYCYGSFGGGSYNTTSQDRRDVPLDRLLMAVHDLCSIGFGRAHICGGEPMLREDIWDLVSALRENNIETFVLSNMSFMPEGFDKHFATGAITNLSFSLDAVNEAYNDSVRGNTSAVMRNITKIVRMKQQYRVATELGLYAVVTRENIAYLDDLIDWCVEIGLDYLSLQLLYLPHGHKYYDRLMVRTEDARFLPSVFEHLLTAGHALRVSGEPFLKLTHKFASGSRLVARNCFCDRDLNYLFIDSSGNVSPCPTKNIKPECVIGNITTGRLTDMITYPADEDVICSELSAECLGVWEMAHPRLSCK